MNKAKTLFLHLKFLKDKIITLKYLKLNHKFD